MTDKQTKVQPWQAKIVPARKVLARIKPGSVIFLSTGVAEPRTLVKKLVASAEGNLQDLEIVQLVSIGDAVAPEESFVRKFRLKTFFAGWVASEAITMGRVDLIPSRFSRIPGLIQSGLIRIDVAFIQISPPDEAGFVSFGPSVDVARHVMEKASLVVGEIHPRVPRTLGDTFVHVDQFDLFVEATEEPIYFPRWKVDPVYDRLGANVAGVIPDGSCISFQLDPLFEGLGRHLAHKQDLGIHTALFTDVCMELVRSGAVTNRRKNYFRGKSVTAYAVGSPELMRWIHMNPLLEFQAIDVVGDPERIARTDNFFLIMPARKIDLSGDIALPSGKGNLLSGPGQFQEFFLATSLSRGGRSVFALPSRDPRGEPNVLLSLQDLPNQLSIRESLDFVATEYGAASLKGRTIRERALSLIEIAHPDDRSRLLEEAKAHHLLFSDQAYELESARRYPEELATEHVFRDKLKVHFRAIRPSDEEGMRQLFYRFSDQSVYYRYFSPVKTMPHAKMQAYVNVDYWKVLSIVALVGKVPEGLIIAEARYVRLEDGPYANVAFAVDEGYRARGIASFMYGLLTEIAQQRGIVAFRTEVLAANAPMLRVFEKGGHPLHVEPVSDSLRITIDLAPKDGGRP